MERGSFRPGRRGGRGADGRSVSGTTESPPEPSDTWLDQATRNGASGDSQHTGPVVTGRWGRGLREVERPFVTRRYGGPFLRRGEEWMRSQRLPLGWAGDSSAVTEGTW